VRAGFINPRGLIRSGSSATVRIPNTVKSGLLVPESATYELQDKRFVYVVDNKNQVKNVAIQVMDNTAGQFYVITDGLHAGDKIILGSSNNLRDGTTIKPNEVSAASVYGNLK
jgi:membrane fusion protein (multidrug efflux system)